jgi:DNA-binding transcriptional ArsR family regulator
MAATFASETQMLEVERLVLDVLTKATTDMKLTDIAAVSKLSMRAVSGHLRRLRGKGKVTKVHGSGHDVFYRRVRR